MNLFVELLCINPFDDNVADTVMEPWILVGSNSRELAIRAIRKKAIVLFVITPTIYDIFRYMMGVCGIYTLSIRTLIESSNQSL